MFEKTKLARPLEGQLAMITGATGGIGSSIATHLAAAGATVLLVARNKKILQRLVARIRSKGGRAYYRCGDLLETDFLFKLLNFPRQVGGRLNLLVNAAGTLQPEGPNNTDMRLNYQSVNDFSVLAASLMMKLNWSGSFVGRIVTISSSMPFSDDAKYAPLYAQSKEQQAIQLNKVAKVFCPFGIATFSVSPGIVRTRLVQEVLDNPEKFGELAKRYQSLAPESWNTPEQTAAFIVELAQGKGDFFTGGFMEAAKGIDYYYSSMLFHLAERLVQERNESP